MKKVTVSLLTAILCASTVQLIALAAGNPPEVGGALPEFRLPVPTNPVHRTYLGVSDATTFTIPEIKADAVIIEIYSMYCPYCQREAPQLNDLYHKIESDPQLKHRIKMIGIGVGNSVFEVDIFRNKYDVPFPLFPDESFSMHKCIGEVRTPYFIGVKINKDGTHRVFYSALGGLKGVDQFLELVVERSGLKQEG
jgi:peroxiredoxin